MWPYLCASSIEQHVAFPIFLHLKSIYDFTIDNLLIFCFREKRFTNTISFKPYQVQIDLPEKWQQFTFSDINVCFILSFTICFCFFSILNASLLINNHIKILISPYLIDSKKKKNLNCLLSFYGLSCDWIPKVIYLLSD